jgi:hypothetical protein
MLSVTKVLSPFVVAGFHKNDNEPIVDCQRNVIVSCPVGCICFTRITAGLTIPPEMAKVDTVWLTIVVATTKHISSVR